MNLERKQTIIGSELLDDHEIHKMSKILHRIIGQMSPEEQDKLNWTRMSLETSQVCIFNGNEDQICEDVILL